MKAKYIVLVLALASVFSACSRDEENLFDKSAAERAQAALDNANEILTAPANGWEMIYFANPDSRGYNIIVTFDKNGKVTATTKNVMIEYADGNGTKKELLVRNAPANAIVTDSSTWEVINDYGPIMTFNTYNNVLHAWADPRDNGDALLGDYEFLILHADANYVKLKGKKQSAYYYLYPLETGVTAAQYFSEVEAMDKRLFGNGNLLHIQANSEEYMLYNGSSGIFMLAGLGESPNEEEAETYPVATMRNGLQFMNSPRALGDVRYTLTGDKMESNASSIFAAPAAAYITEHIEMASGSWSVDTTNINDSSAHVIEKINATLKATYTKNKKNASVKSLTFKKTSKGLVVVFSYYGSSSKATTDMNYLFNIATEGNSVKITYNGPADENAQKTINAFPDIEVLLKTLDGSFDAIATDAINPSNGIKITNKSHSELWFSIQG